MTRWCCVSTTTLPKASMLTSLSICSPVSRSQGWWSSHSQAISLRRAWPRENAVRYGRAVGVSNIGGDLTIVGNVTSKGEINLDGHVRGDIHCVALVLGEN